MKNDSEGMVETMQVKSEIDKERGKEEQKEGQKKGSIWQNVMRITVGETKRKERIHAR